MNDLEITILCAEAMGYEVASTNPNDFGGKVFTDVAHNPGTILIKRKNITPGIYQPLHDDAQAMALVKRLQLIVYPPKLNDCGVWTAIMENGLRAISDDANRAICECVAKSRAP